MDTTIHKFERANLGTAPFRVVGFEEKRGPIDLGNGLTTGSPNQPMGCCDFCGTGIADCFHIESADHKRFIVGSTCVNKTGDKGLIVVVKKKINELKTIARHARETAKIDELKTLLVDPNIQAQLSALSHPNHGAFFADRTMLDWANWMMVNAGNAGKLSMLRTIKALVPAR